MNLDFERDDHGHLTEHGHAQLIAWETAQGLLTEEVAA